MAVFYMYTDSVIAVNISISTELRALPGLREHRLCEYRDRAGNG